MPQNFYVQPSGVLTPTSLPLPATPPFSIAPDATAVPIPTFKSSPIPPKNTETLFQPSPRGALGLDTEAKEGKAEDSDGEERSLTPVAGVTVEGSEQTEEQSPASVGKDPIAVTKVTKSESTESDGKCWLITSFSKSRTGKMMNNSPRHSSLCHFER